MMHEECLKLVPDAEIDAVWGNANFGTATKRQIIAETLLNHAGEFSSGHTATQICQELGLLGKHNVNWKPPRLTKKGKKYLFWAYYMVFSPPAPDAVQELVDTLDELADIVQGIIDGDTNQHSLDSFTLQPARTVLAKHSKPGER